MKKSADYSRFIADNKDKNILFLEIGVGFNTPSIIRWPFEDMAQRYPNAKMIRMNREHSEVPVILKDKGIVLEGDIREALLRLGAVSNTSGV